MDRRIGCGRPREGAGGVVDSELDGAVGAIGKKRAIASGRSETLIDFPYDLGVITGSDVLLS
jgi:hypothetical protein